MSQHDMNIANQSFPSFRSDLNNALSAIQTTHSGTSRPTGAVAGQIWLDTTSATSPTLKFYDGADDISLATINYTANTVDWLDSSVTITGLSTTATGTVLTLTDSAHTTSVNMICGNNTALRFNELTANGSNYIGLKAPASLSADLTFTLPSTDGTSGQFLKTDGAGNLSFGTVNLSTPFSIVASSSVGSEIRIPEATTNGANYVGFKAPDSLAADKVWTLPSADGTSGQVLQTNGSGVLSFSSPSSDYVKLASGTISSSVSSFTLDGYFTSTYNKYVVYVNNLQLTADAGIFLRYVKSGSELTSNHNFSVTGGYRNSSGGYGTSGSSGWGVGAVDMYAEATVESDANKSFSAVITIDSPLSTNVHHRLHYSIVTSVSNGYFIQLHGGSENDLNTTALSGIKIYTTQNFDTGNYQLYGIKA